MKQFCTECWKEIGTGIAQCSFCGTDQNKLSQEPFVLKLIRALHSPEPETPIRAAYVRGQLQASEAVPSLVEIVERDSDPFIKASAIRALGAIGGYDAMICLNKLRMLELGLVENWALQEALGHTQNVAPSET